MLTVECEKKIGERERWNCWERTKRDVCGKLRGDDDHVREWGFEDEEDHVKTKLNNLCTTRWLHMHLVWPTDIKWMGLKIGNWVWDTATKFPSLSNPWAFPFSIWIKKQEAILYIYLNQKEIKKKKQDDMSSCSFHALHVKNTEIGK